MTFIVFTDGPSFLESVKVYCYVHDIVMLIDLIWPADPFFSNIFAFLPIL